MAKTVAIFIAFNAGKTLEKFYQSFPRNLVDDIILVDDASKDNTYKLAQQLGIHSYRNSVNLGYGGNVKKAIFLALKQGANIIIDIHPDGEYIPTAISSAIYKIEHGAEFILGNRFTTMDKPLKTGMYFWKIIPIITLNWLCKKILRAGIDDYHQGFRVYTRKMLKKINFEKNSNNYLFSIELISQAVLNKVIINQVPVETKYEGKKRGASLKDSVKYFLQTLKVLILFILAKIGLNTKIFKTPTIGLDKRIEKYFYP